jgi:hypothetical protein
VSASTQATCVADVSQETEEAERKSKEDGPVADSTKAKALFASTQAPQITAQAKPREVGEGVEEDQTYSINTNAVFASTQTSVTFNIATPKFSQVRDPAPS